MSIYKPEWAPLGLDSWSHDNFGSSLKVIDEELKKFPTDERPHCLPLAEAALRGSLAKQTERNHAISHLDVDDEDLYNRAKRGLLSPAEAVKLFVSQPAVKSMEIARLTHVGDWNTNSRIDTPVRAILSEDESLQTQKVTSSSYYKINALGAYQSPEAVAVKRKREILSHMGGSAITVVTNTFLVDLEDKTPESRSLRKAIHDSLGQVKERLDDDERHDYMKDELEVYLRNKEPDEKPSFVIPLSTLYYATRPSERP